MVKLWESAIRLACWCVSAGLLAESGPGQGYIQLLVVLDQGCVAVVVDQLSQRRVEVVGLSKAVPRGRPVDHAVFHVSVGAAMEGIWVTLDKQLAFKGKPCLNNKDGICLVGIIIPIVALKWQKDVNLSYSHNRAGKGSPLSLAVSDEEGPIPLSPEQLLCILPPHCTNVPAAVLQVLTVREGVRTVAA